MRTPAARQYRGGISDSARWERIELRPDDVIISTPPKCGTTWAQMICALLIFQTPALPARLSDLSPWADTRTETVDSMVAALAAQTHRRFIKTHTPLDGLPYDDQVTYLCVGRDPRDVAVSWLHHDDNADWPATAAAIAAADPGGDPPPLTAGSPEAAAHADRFWQWIEQEPVAESASTQPGLAGLVTHLRTSWDRRGLANVLLLHYADMQVDLDGQMRRVASALDLPVDPAVWGRLVEAARFESMRSQAQHLAPQLLGVNETWHDPRRFFHQGANGQWRQFIRTAEDAKRYERRVTALASSEFLRWLHEGAAQGADAGEAADEPAVGL